MNFKHKIRPAVERDAEAVSEIFCQVYDANMDKVFPLIEKEFKWLSMGIVPRHVFVAEHAGKVIGYGRSGRLTKEALKDARSMPIGWYLMGIVVLPEMRRRGIARALTRERLKVMKKISRVIYYFCNKDNEASIRLHEEFSFKVHSRDFYYPTRDFGPGEGVLFRRG